MSSSSRTWRRRKNNTFVFCWPPSSLILGTLIIYNSVCLSHLQEKVLMQSLYCSQVWFMGEFSHISVEFDNVCLVGSWVLKTLDCSIICPNVFFFSGCLCCLRKLWRSCSIFHWCCTTTRQQHCFWTFSRRSWDKDCFLDKNCGWQRQGHCICVSLSSL